MPIVPDQSITVRITVDGTSTDITANLNRPDLANAFGGSGNWAFTYTPNLAPGSHSVTVAAVDPQTNAVVTLKQGTLVNNPPIGNADIITSTRVAGWAFDKDLGSGPVTIRIDSNGQTVSTVTANMTRMTSPPPSARPTGFDVSGNFGVVDIWAIDSPSGTPVLIKSTNKTPVGNVEVLGRGAPPRAGSTIPTTPPPPSPSSSKSIRLSPPSPPTGSARCRGRHRRLPPPTALRPVTPSRPEPTTSRFSPKKPTPPRFLKSFWPPPRASKIRPPTGSLDGVSTTNTSPVGHFDADAGSGPVTVQAFVDGTLNATGTANLSRPDIVGVTGSPNHGYSINLSGVNVAPHRIQIYVLDNPTGTAVKIADKVIDNTPPRGSIDLISPYEVSGWAQDPDDPTTAIQIIPVLDGTAYPAATAGDTRDDLTPVIGSANHGFTYQMPTHLFGVHTLQLVGVDTADGSTTVIATAKFTNNAPTGTIDFANASGVGSWTFDKDDPTKSIDVLIQIDGTIVARATASINRPDLASITGGSTAHGYSVGYSGLPKGQHTIKVFAVDPATGVTQPIGTKIINV